ncbi:MAG TPA: bifunctional glutamate N-acetyltransferase/amino-acid acetyltransferase ArgJ [Verrucomicrobiae bacterium]|nr:bifunctional glutamate N-acetyltransferase/amino-acid acetyltransferase ArgJ [Verrucomicrobiae bacterium]
MKKQQGFSKISGSVTAPRGFRAAGVAAGIKASGKKDMALIVSEPPATVASVFTTNQVKAAPVKLSMRHAQGGKACAIVANSGNANACTKDGTIHARAMAVAVARRLGCPENHVLVCSTGRIGVNLPIVKVEDGIKKLLRVLSSKGGAVAARAIMTTDTFAKEVAVQFKAGGKTFRIGGMAKGAGMIQPKMATMLSFIATDAAIPRAALQKALTRAVNQSFNRITVDGDTSTNDTVLLLANGVAGKPPLAKFQEALDYVCLELAKMIVRDGEGVTKFVTINVRGAQSDSEAEMAARTVANSVLVKTSWCGGDPNWGRILDALGYSRAKVRDDLVEIAYDGVTAVTGGMASPTPLARLKRIVAQPTFTIDIHLHLGRGQCTMHTCDLTEKYVELNKGE